MIATSGRLQGVALLLLALYAFSDQISKPDSEKALDDKFIKGVMDALNMTPGSTVADVGCGDGFYTLPMARYLGPFGKVYAEDISDDELNKLKEHLAKDGIHNVEAIKGAVDDPRLPVNQFDAVLIVNAYHEMVEPEAMLHHVSAALKSGGTFVLMECMWDSKEGQPRSDQVKGHMLSPQMATQEVLQAGFNVVELRDRFHERPPDKNGKSRWWIMVARKPK